MSVEEFVDKFLYKLEDAKKTFLARNMVYKNNWETTGEVLRAMFPDGLTLETSDDFARFSLLIQQIGKLTRYCSNFKMGGHADSSKDLAVYSLILHTFDELNGEKQAKSSSVIVEDTQRRIEKKKNDEIKMEMRHNDSL